jgi:pantoate--beta-alanine ligase
MSVLTSPASKIKPPIVSRIAEVRSAVTQARKAGRTVAFVPTMGALHAGHVSLMQAAKKSGAFVVVSIYVNPTQFGPREDLAKYPRTLEADGALCAEAGVDLIFAPADGEIYPPGDETRVRPGAMADRLCGPFRPGHFEGVCTVVAKLFNIVQPDIACFGQKDAQQAVIIRRMVKDLLTPIRIEVCPIVRDADGLALSSRNARLDPAQRAGALSLYRSLCVGRDKLMGGERSMGRIIAAMRETIAAAGNHTVDYLAIVDPETLRDVETPSGRLMLAGAMRLGDVRLIDNLLVDLPANRP